MLGVSGPLTLKDEWLVAGCWLLVALSDSYVFFWESGDLHADLPRRFLRRFITQNAGTKRSPFSKENLFFFQASKITSSGIFSF